MDNFIFIPHEVKSKKTSQRWTGKRLIASKLCFQYYKLSKADWEKNKNAFLKEVEGLSFPYRVEFTFIRLTKRRADLINLCQTVADLMVTYGYMPDDDYKHFVPYFADVQIDKANPGVLIKVIK